VKIVLLAVGLGGVAISYGSLVGVEPGLGVLLSLLSLKLLETNTVRDFQVLVLLGWFLCLCGLFFSQDLTTWIYFCGVATLLGASLIGFHGGSSCGGLFQSLGFALKLVIQALPIIALLFIFFPRTSGGFRLQFNRSVNAVTGMSDRLEPGSFARLTQNENIAFRAEFPDGKLPSFSQLYWRGAVLWRGEGLTWVRGPREMRVEEHTHQLDGPAIRQRISLKPHGGHWLFALDRPAVEVRESSFEPGGCLRSSRPVVAPHTYDVISRPDNREVTLLSEHEREALQRPKDVAPRVQSLVDSWRGPGISDREIIDAALRYFRKEKFTYSLTPQTYGVDALAEFLFERRTGFCEHYAAAFATLMRLAGIPSRVVVGYHGGEYGIGNYIIVKQLDAHAWTEVWLKNEGWLRVDPTTVIAPERITSGSESFLESQALADNLAGAGTSIGVAGLRDLLRQARLVWDNLRYQWDLRVVSYDEDSQHSVLMLVGLEDMAPSTIIVWLTLGALLLCGLAGLALGRSRNIKLDPLLRDYQRFCRTLAAAGVPREPWEGPQHFSDRAARAFPQHATAIREAATLYIAARYARKSAASSSFRRAVRTLPRLARLPGGATSRNE
jgi:transglutaminase-like putative cysteine protease